MKKRNLLTIIFSSVFLIAFNVVFFANGTENSASTWICYGFLHFSYFMFLLIPVIEAKGKTAYLSTITTYSISLSYFLLELLFSIFIFTLTVDKSRLVDLIQRLVPFYSAELASSLVNSITAISVLSSFVLEIDTTLFTLFVQVILAAIYIILLIPNLLVNDTIAKKQELHDIQNYYIKTISAKVKFIESITTDNVLKNKVNNLYYTIHTSPTKTCDEVSVYELKIQELLEDLETLVLSDKESANEKIIQIEQMVNKRNFMLNSRR